ncbi:Pentatricopeptide repeat-containing protein [Diplonema papillatum]|nr:Pentatricopeptide repeat-containing protein [Diplonema papillatum]
MLHTKGDVQCAKILIEYFANTGKRALRSAVRTKQVFATFYEDFAKLKQSHRGVGPLAYGVALKTFAYGGNVHLCKMLWGDMIADGITPNVALYNYLITAAAHAGDVHKASETMKEMRASGVEPDGRSYLLVLLLFAKRRDRANCEKVLATMLHNHHYPTERTLSIMLLCAKNHAEAMEIVEKFKRWSVRLGTAGYSAILFSCMTGGPDDAANAEKVFRRARTDPRVKVDYELWVAYIGALKGAGDYEKLCEGIRKMHDDGFTADVRVYYYLLDICTERSTEDGDDHAQRAEAVYRSCIAQDIVDIPVLTKMIRLWGRLRRLDKVEQVRTYLSDTMCRGETEGLVAAVRAAYVSAGRTADEVVPRVVKKSGAYNIPEYKFHGRQGKTDLGKNPTTLNRLRITNQEYHVLPRRTS